MKNKNLITKRKSYFLSILLIIIVFTSCVDNKTYPSKPSVFIVKEVHQVKGGMNKYKIEIPDYEGTDMGSTMFYCADSIGKFNAGDTLQLSYKNY